MIHGLRVFLCAPVHAAGLHHPVEQLGLLGFGGKEIQAGLQGKKGRDPPAPPVGYAAGQGDIRRLAGTDQLSAGNMGLDLMAVSAMPISLPPSPMEMVSAPKARASDRNRAESVIMSSMVSPRMLW